MKDAFDDNDGPAGEGANPDRDLNLLEQNLSALLCEQLDTQRSYFENKLEQKREALKKEVVDSADARVKELSVSKESVQREMVEKKTQYAFIRKNRVVLEQKIENLRKAIQEEESINETLERQGGNELCQIMRGILIK